MVQGGLYQPSFSIGMVILEHKLDGVTASALSRFASRAQKAVRLRGSVNILVTSSQQLQDLNRRFRRKNKPTDVLSFPSEVEGSAGDIAISAEIAKTNGKRLGHGAATELKILMLHGMLHLSGHDHETDNGEMERKEKRLRSLLGLPEGLIERSSATSKMVKKTTRPRSRKR